MSAQDNLNEHQFEMMRPSELLPYAGDRSDKFAVSKVNVLADSIKEHGYHHDLMKGNRSPIILDHRGRWGSELTEGNHRVHAMVKIGYDEPVPVRNVR